MFGLRDDVSIVHVQEGCLLMATKSAMNLVVRCKQIHDRIVQVFSCGLGLCLALGSMSNAQQPGSKPEPSTTTPSTAPMPTTQPSDVIPGTSSATPTDGTLPASVAPQAKAPDADTAASAEEVGNAVVVEVTGAVDRAPSGVSPMARDGWTAIKVGDTLEPGTQIRTGLRSSVNLRFGDATYVSVRSATHASVDQFYRSAKAERVRMGLGYGAIRGGSIEGEIKSDVTIDSTVATLAKRGTEGWQIVVEPGTGRFRISLAESGLVEARRKLADDRVVSRFVRPGEYATRDNIANMWLKQDSFDRNVTFYDANAVGASDADFSAANTKGLAVLAPAGGSQLATAAGRNTSAFTDSLGGVGDSPVRPPDVTPGRLPPVSRPDGNFGTGQTFNRGTPAPSVESRKSTWRRR